MCASSVSGKQLFLAEWRIISTPTVAASIVDILRLISSAIETYLCLSPDRARDIPVVSDADSVSKLYDRLTVCQRVEKATYAAFSSDLAVTAFFSSA